jgi:nucleotide-binding universal stress UspA family protein
MFKHILLPTDGSEAAMRAVTQGIELARQLGAQVTVMTVLEHFPDGIMGSAYRPEELQEEEPGLQVAQERLAAALRVAHDAGIRAQHLLVRDKAVHTAIVEAAKTSGADLIVMGTHGLGLIERIFIGSQTQRVLSHTHVPVLTVH